MEGEKKERPQNKNLKPLGSGQLSPEEELEIRRKGNKASQEARHRNASMRAAVRAVANLNANGRVRSVEVEKLKSVQELTDGNAPLIAKLVYTQFLSAMQGDKEARDWICRMLGEQALNAIDASGLTITAEGQAVDEAGGVRIHLIRGTRPEDKTDGSDEVTATRANAAMATLQALQAIANSEPSRTDDDL